MGRYTSRLGTVHDDGGVPIEANDESTAPIAGCCKSISPAANVKNSIGIFMEINKLRIFFRITFGVFGLHTEKEGEHFRFDITSIGRSAYRTFFRAFMCKNICLFA